MPRAPLTLASGRVKGTGGAGGPLAAHGSVGLAGGVRAEFDLASQPGHLDLRRLAVQDPDTDAQVTLNWAASTAELAFRGTLDSATRARVLAEPPARQGALRGDFHATIDLAEPWQSSATGALEGDRIVGAILVTHWMGMPLVAELGVAKDRRGRGVGRALLEAAMGRLAGRDEPRLALYVTVGNDAATNLYRSLGFTQVGGQSVTARLEP